MRTDARAPHGSVNVDMSFLYMPTFRQPNRVSTAAVRAHWCSRAVQPAERRVRAPRKVTHMLAGMPCGLDECSSEQKGRGMCRPKADLSKCLAASARPASMSALAQP
jgi:hypothetical protein